MLEVIKPKQSAYKNIHYSLVKKIWEQIKEDLYQEERQGRNFKRKQKWQQRVWVGDQRYICNCKKVEDLVTISKIERKKVHERKPQWAD